MPKFLLIFCLSLFFCLVVYAQKGHLVFNGDLGGNFSNFKMDRQGAFIYNEHTMYRATDFTKMYSFPISISFISDDGTIIGGHLDKDNVAIFSSVTGAMIAELNFRDDYSDKVVAMDEHQVYIFNEYKGAKKIQWKTGIKTEFQEVKTRYTQAFESHKKGIYTVVYQDHNSLNWSIWDLDQMQLKQTFIPDKKFGKFEAYNAYVDVLVLSGYVENNSDVRHYGFYHAATGNLIKEFIHEKPDKVFSSYDNGYLFMQGDRVTDLVVDASSGQFIKKMPSNKLLFNGAFSGVHMNIYGTEFHAPPAKDRFVLFDLATIRKIKEINIGFEPVTDVGFGLNGDYLLLNGNSCFDMQNLKPIAKSRYVPSGSLASNTLEMQYDAGLEKWFLFNHATAVKTPVSLPKDLFVPQKGLMMSADGKKLYALGTPDNTFSLYVYDIGTKIWKKLIGIGEVYYPAFSDDRQFISYVHFDRTKKAASLVVLKIASLQKMCSIDVSDLIQVDRFKGTGTMPLNGGDAVVYTDATTLYIFDVKSGTIVQKTASGCTENNLMLSGDQSKIVAANGQFIFIHDLDGRLESVLPVQTGHQFFSKSFMLSQQNKVAVIWARGDVRIVRTKDGKQIGRFYLYNNGNDYLFLSDDGRFEGTEEGMKQLYYLKNRQYITLDKVFERYYTPNLYIRLANGEDFPSVETDLHEIPRVHIRYAEVKRNLEVTDDIQAYVNSSGVGEFTVTATAPQDKVDEIRLFHNGKAVNLATRGLFVTDEDGSDTKKYTINLLPGTNNFRAVALNSQRTESDPDEITVIYTKEGNTPAPTPAPAKPDNKTAVVDVIERNGTLHIVVVGINAYKDKISPLTYALPDATAFKAELEKDAKSVINHVNSYLITDDAATKVGIMSAFDHIKKSAKPEDVFVFYYAGHGYIHPDNKEFYLVSSDVADGGESLLKNGISSKELQSFAVDIPAQKQLFIMDACQSAGAFEKMLQHDGEQQKALAVVSRSTGTHWMAASGSTETAKEFGELGHGVFTYSLLEALKGKAVDNKMITVNGLKNYLQQIVPELVRKYGSSGQYPASYGFGNDFPVEILK